MRTPWFTLKGKGLLALKISMLTMPLILSISMISFPFLTVFFSFLEFFFLLGFCILIDICNTVSSIKLNDGLCFVNFAEICDLWLEIVNFVRDIRDPEHPYSLEQLSVLSEESITVDDKLGRILWVFLRCSQLSLIILILGFLRIYQSFDLGLLLFCFGQIHFLG